MSWRRRLGFLLVAAAHATLAAPMRAQTPVLLQGIADGEFWVTDTNSNLLSRNGGRPAGVGRLHLWSAIEPLRNLALYGMVEVEGASGGDVEHELEQYGLRYTASRRLVIDAGKLVGPVGGFAARRFSTRNPLIGAPDGYTVQYPLGLQLSGSTRFVDYRAAAVSLPTVHEEYTPEPSSAWRPAFGLGITPFVGVRLGASYTWGPYLNRELTASQLAQRDWRDYEQRVAATELAISVGYTEIFAEAAVSRYEVPNGAEPVEGLTYYAEAKYTFTPRLYVAARLGRNDYPFIRLVSPTFWVARKTDFHDEEIGIGVRVSAATLAKVSYRQDKWHVDAGNEPFVGPGGQAVAFQLSHSYDVINWIERSRTR